MKHKGSEKDMGNFRNRVQLSCAATLAFALLSKLIKLSALEMPFSIFWSTTYLAIVNLLSAKRILHSVDPIER